jgi:hypothetical protein
LPAGRSPSPAFGGAGLRSARATPSLWRANFLAATV